MPRLHETRMGQVLIERTLPGLVKALDRLGAAVELQSSSKQGAKTTDWREGGCPLVAEFVEESGQGARFEEWARMRRQMTCEHPGLEKWETYCKHCGRDKAESACERKGGQNG